MDFDNNEAQRNLQNILGNCLLALDMEKQRCIRDCLLAFNREHHAYFVNHKTERTLQDSL